MPVAPAMAINARDITIEDPGAVPGGSTKSSGVHPDPTTQPLLLTGPNQDRLMVNNRAFVQRGSPVKRHTTSANDNGALAIAA